MTGYTIERTQHGVLIRGEVPVSELVALTKVWKEAGFTLIHPGLAAAAGAGWAVTSPEALPKWEAEIAAKAKHNANGDRELEWLLGHDTGISSLTICAVLSGQHSVAAAVSRGPFGADVPHDPADFGRCYRLLQAIPEWRGRLGEVAKAHRIWRPFVREWDAMTALYEEERVLARAPKLYALMQKLEAESRKKTA